MARIGIDARLTYYRQGGIAHYIEEIIHHIPQFDSSNQYIILHSRKDKRNLAQTDNQRRAICWTPSHHRIERLALSIEMLPHRLDLLHSPDFIPPMFGYRKSVITIHDLTFLHFPEFLTDESKRYYNEQIEAAVKRANHIMTDSEATRQDVIRMLNVPPEKVTTVLLGIDEDFKPADNETVQQVKTKCGLPDNYILFLGTFEPRKNLKGLLHAYARLRRMMEDVPSLVVAGRQGWLFEEIFELAANLGIRDSIAWREDIAYGDLPGLYSGASLLCLPSFYEGFGFPPLEAMACHTPSVVSNRGSLPEVVGDASLQVNPDDAASIADAMLQVLTNPKLADDLRQRGAEQVKLFTWEKTVTQVLETYRKVLQS